MTLAHKFGQFFYFFTTPRGLRTLAIVGGILVLGALGGGAYYWYQNNKAEQAQRDFAAAFEEFERIWSPDNPSSWETVEQAFEVGYQKHANSSLAPYFLAFKAEALVQEGKHAEALVVIDKVMKDLPESSPLYYLYATKQSLMMFDSQDQEVKDKGMKLLESLAGNNKNPYNDMAQFYLGYIYNAQDEVKAQNIWSMLQQQGMNSLWAYRASMYRDVR